MNVTTATSRAPITTTTAHEQSAIGALLTWPDRYADRLREDFFTIPEHRHVCRLLRLQYAEHGEVDPILLRDDLAAAMKWSPFTATGTLNEIMEFCAIAESRGEIAVRTLERDWANRQRADAFDVAVRKVERGGDVGEAIARLRAVDDELRADENRANLIEAADLLHVDPADEPDELVPTGLGWWDSAMPEGAMARGRSTYIAAPPKLGKSALCLQLTLSALIRNPNLRAVWGLGEMAPRTLRNRALMCLSGLALGVLKRQWDDLSPTQTTAKREAIEAYRELGRRWSILPAPLTPERIETAITTTGATWAVIDYLQICRSGRDTTSRRDDIDAVIGELTRMTQRHGLVLIVVSDMPKGVLVGRDLFNAFKESAGIPYAADLAYVGEPVNVADVEGGDMPAMLDIRWRCLASRHGDAKSITTRLDRFAQRFHGIGGAR